MKSFSKVVLTKFLFFLATSLMLISCGGSDNRSNSGSSVDQPVVKPIPNEKVVYVCADGKTDANGSSWDTCTAKIQDAIKQAQDNGKDLWFLAGDYNLTQTIVIENKDLKLFGGFKGTESKLSDRKLDTNATVLSGNKKIRVLKTENLSDKSVLDGFVITQGDEYLGAGMHNKNSNILIKNVIFSKNTAKHNGGAMYNKTSNLTLTNVSFVKNQAEGGGAISNNQTNLIITNASFSKNNASNYGGAIHNGSNDTTKFINTTFSENTAGDEGSVTWNSLSNQTFINVTITKNRSSYAITTLNGSNPTIKNSILWGNGTNEIEYEGISTPVITNSIIKGDSNNNGSQDPKLSQTPKTKIVNGVTHVYYDLEANSPAINAGNNDDNNETTDQIGNKRTQGAKIDMGAVEKQ